MLDAYNRRLASHPFSTNLATAGVATFLGDVLAQHVEIFRSQPEGEGRVRATLEAEKSYKRTAVMTSWGATLYAGIWLPWYKIMDKTVTLARPVVAAAALKSALTAAIAAPIANSVFFTYVTTVEYMLEPPELRKVTPLPTRIREKLDADLLSTWAASAKLWGPVMTLNWWIVPTQYRFIVSVFTAVGWNCFLSLVQHRGHNHPALSQIDEIEDNLH